MPNCHSLMVLGWAWWVHCCMQYTSWPHFSCWAKAKVGSMQEKKLWYRLWYSKLDHNSISILCRFRLMVLWFWRGFKNLLLKMMRWILKVLKHEIEMKTSDTNLIWYLWYIQFIHWPNLSISIANTWWYKHSINAFYFRNEQWNS